MLLGETSKSLRIDDSRVFPFPNNHKEFSSSFHVATPLYATAILNNSTLFYYSTILIRSSVYWVPLPLTSKRQQHLE